MLAYVSPWRTLLNTCSDTVGEFAPMLKIDDHSTPWQRERWCDDASCDFANSIGTRLDTNANGPDEDSIITLSQNLLVELQECSC